VLVTDSDRVTRGPGTARGNEPAIRPRDLFTDPNLAQRLAAILDAQRAASGPGTRNWDEYLDQCAGRIGQPLLRFALGLPQLPQAGDENEGSIGVSDQVKARYRRWAATMAELSHALPIAERLLAIQAVLCVVGQGLWDGDDQGWYSPLAEAVRGLGDGDLPAEAEAAAGSLAAVALSILRASAPRYWQTRETRDYVETSSAVGHLLLAADPDLIAEYVSWLGTAFGSAALPDVVLDTVAEVIDPDPIADVISGLAEIGHDAHAHGPRLLHLNGRFGNPVLAALEGVGAVQDMDFVGVWATSTAGPWALVIWRSPDIVIVDGRSPVPLWQHRRLSSLQRPKGLAAGKDLSSAPLVPHGPQNRPFPEAGALLHLLGLSAPNPPAECGPERDLLLLVGLHDDADRVVGQQERDVLKGLGDREQQVRHRRLGVPAEHARRDAQLRAVVGAEVFL
jgi:hypothetical protein